MAGRDGYGRCLGCGLKHDHIDTCQYARSRVTLTLRASITVPRQHDVEKHLGDLKRQFANDFSIAVHEFYPDASVVAFVEVLDV